MDEPEIMDKTDEQPLPSSERYLKLLKKAKTSFGPYTEKCTNIEAQYADLAAMSQGVGDREFKLFWANLEVLKPTVYSRPPIPVVSVRHKDRKEIKRKTAEVLERALETAVELDDIHATMIHVRDDLVLSGRGVPWVLDNGNIIHINRKDFLHDPCRKWSECGWVAKCDYITKKEGIEVFGEVFQDAETAKMADEGDDYLISEPMACVWEMWHKKDNIVIRVVKGVETVLDVNDPLQLEGFFPCPKPAYSTVEPNTLKPVPDFVYYKDQIEEINELTARISALAESLRMKGFYSSGVSEVGEAIETALNATDDKALLVPVSNVAALGGAALKDSIIWLPVVEVANTIQQLVLLRKQLIEDVYEITGLSDIMRGSTDANETLGAQQLKSQFGNVRVRGRQEEMARIARDVIRIKAEIMAETFEIQHILELAQVDDVMTNEQVQQQVMQQAQEAMARGQQPQQPDLKDVVTVERIDALLKNQRLRPFVLDIETDSTIQPDEQAEKENRMEFMTTISGFMAQAGPMVTQQPQSAKFVGQLFKFTASAFRAGRELEPAIDEFVEQMEQIASQPQPNPEAEAAKAEAQAKERDAKMREAELQMKAREAQQGAVINMRQAEAELVKTGAQIENINADTDLKESQANAPRTSV